MSSILGVEGVMKLPILTCSNGHSYKDVRLGDWPEGAPKCPLCCKNWIYTNPSLHYRDKLKLMSRIRKVIEESYLVL